MFAVSLFRQQISMDQAEASLDRGVASVALSERLCDLGLTLSDGSVHDHRMEEFMRTGAKVRQKLPVQLAETVVAHRDSEITNGPKEAAAQRVQLGRKRSGLSFRELFSAYGSQITAAAPCLIMSPVLDADSILMEEVESGLLASRPIWEHYYCHTTRIAGQSMSQDRFTSRLRNLH